MAPGTTAKGEGFIPTLDNLESAKRNKVDSVVMKLQLSKNEIQRIRNVFEDEMDLGLSKSPSRPSSLQMANTFIPQLPDGTEDGEFLALDLGGTNFRVILLELVKGRVKKEEVKYFHVPEHLRLGPGVDLFDFLADCINQFMEEYKLTGRKFALGFTFSFPMHQKGLNSGILVSWTKSFNCPGVVGEDAVKMLNDAIKKRGDLDVEVTAVLNDTTGTLIQGAYLDKKVAIGLILGTGSNGCYIEKVDRVHTWEGPKPANATEVIIDTEFGAFGDNGVLDFIKTEFDRQVDEMSLLVNSFTFEKYYAGKYLGEIVRVILLKMVKEGLLFDGRASEKLSTHDAFTTRYVSMIEEDSIHNLNENTKTILEELEVNFGADDIAIVKYVCFIVTKRGAQLVSICLASLLDRMERPDVTIAIDGSLFKHHPRLNTLMYSYISQYAPTRKFSLLLAEDGSGKGAGLTAAIAKRLKV